MAPKKRIPQASRPDARSARRRKAPKKSNAQTLRQEINAADLTTARLHWQMGSWDKLAELEVESLQTGSMSRDQVELLLYRMQGLFVSGAVDEGHKLARAMSEAGVSRHTLGAALISGAQSNVARARLINGQPAAARQSLASAVALNPDAGDTEQVATLRFVGEQRNLLAHRSAASGRLPYIDVIGPQGSGKTTLIDALCDHDVFAKLKSPQKSENESRKAQTLFRFLIDFPGFAGVLSQSIWEMHEGETLLEFLTGVILKYQSAVAQPGRFLLFDEGFVCRAISFAYLPELEENLLREYYRTIPLPSQLIALRLPLDDCIERIEKRPKGYSKRMVSLPLPARRTVLERMIRITDIAVETMAELGVPVIECDTRDPIDTIVSATIEAILSQPMR